MAKTKFVPCKEYLKAFRIIVGAKKDEKIDKRYRPHLAPNDKRYDAHCGYCAEVEYLADIHDHDIALKGGLKNV